VLIARTQDTWPCLLEDELRASGKKVEVVNAGRQGFTTMNEAEWLEREGERFAPDRIILQFGMNDAVPSYPGLRAERSFWYYHPRPLLGVLDPYLQRGSYLYSALNSFGEHWGMRHLHPRGYLPLYDEGSVGWQQVRAALRAIATWSHAHGARVLVVIFPDLEDDTVLAEGRYRYAPIHAKVAEAAQADGMEVLDLLPAFIAAARPPEAWWPLPCEALAGVEAQQLAARAIAARIEPALTDTPPFPAHSPRS
jgi:lysophospholipase L1-like esterase